MNLIFEGPRTEAREMFEALRDSNAPEWCALAASRKSHESYYTATDRKQIAAMVAKKLRAA